MKCQSAYPLKGELYYHVLSAQKGFALSGIQTGAQNYAMVIRSQVVPSIGRFLFSFADIQGSS